MQKIWRQVGPVPMHQRKRYACMVAEFTKAFGCIGWCVTVGQTFKGGGIFFSFTPFPRNEGTKVLKWKSAIVFKGGSLASLMSPDGD